MTTAKLFAPCELNGLALNNRIAMSPVTRARASESGHVGELQATYYGQRGDTGLLFTEALGLFRAGVAARSCPVYGLTAMWMAGARSPMRCMRGAANFLPTLACRPHQPVLPVRDG